jgi:hypothetical protein
MIFIPNKIDGGYLLWKKFTKLSGVSQMVTKFGGVWFLCQGGYRDMDGAEKMDCRANGEVIF